MANLIQTTVSLPEDLSAAAASFAQARRCSLDGLTEDALRSFLGLETGNDPAFEANRQEARALGLTPEEYSVHVVKQMRAEKRAEQQQASAA